MKKDITSTEWYNEDDYAYNAQYGDLYEEEGMKKHTIVIMDDNTPINTELQEYLDTQQTVVHYVIAPYKAMPMGRQKRLAKHILARDDISIIFVYPFVGHLLFTELNNKKYKDVYLIKGKEFVNRTKLLEEIKTKFDEIEYETEKLEAGALFETPDFVFKDLYKQYSRLGAEIDILTKK